MPEVGSLGNGDVGVLRTVGSQVHIMAVMVWLECNCSWIVAVGAMAHIDVAPRRRRVI